MQFSNKKNKSAQKRKTYEIAEKNTFFAACREAKCQFGVVYFLPKKNL